MLEELLDSKTSCYRPVTTLCRRVCTGAAKTSPNHKAFSPLAITSLLENCFEVSSQRVALKSSFPSRCSTSHTTWCQLAHSLLAKEFRTSLAERRNFRTSLAERRNNKRTARLLQDEGDLGELCLPRQQQHALKIAEQLKLPASKPSALCAKFSEIQIHLGQLHGEQLEPYQRSCNIC